MSSEQRHPSAPAPSPRALVDTPVTVGDARSIDLAHQLARFVSRENGLPEPVCERVSMNAVFSAGPAVIRIGRTNADPMAAIHWAELLASEGIAVAAPIIHQSFRHDEISSELTATVWHRVEIDPSVAVDWTSVGSMIRRVHTIDPSRVASVHPVPAAADFSWWNTGPVIEGFDDETIDLVTHEGRDRLLESWHRLSPVLDAVRQGPIVVCHGDVHPGNVVVDARTGSPIVLDWDLTCMASPSWDHAALMTWAGRWGGSGDVYESFCRGYGRDMRDDASAVALAELRLLTAMVMRIAAARRDDSAVPEMLNRLRYFTEGPSAPMWHAV